jgi:hypothetical protein
MKKQLQKQ